MARPIKKGLEYFPMDVDFFEDDKLQFLSARFGFKGEIIAIKLLCKIYKENGYYYTWGEDEALLFAKRVGSDYSHTLVNDVVQELIKRGFFDKTIFDSFKILTSNGIQKRYEQIVQNSKLKREKIKKEYKLGVNSEEIEKNSEQLAKNSEESTQSKVKESKVKESRVKNEFSPPHPTFENNSHVPTIEKVMEQFIQKGGTEEMANKFHSKHSATGYMIGHTRLTNWGSLVHTFITNWKENENKPINNYSNQQQTKVSFD